MKSISLLVILTILSLAPTLADDRPPARFVAPQGEVKARSTQSKVVATELLTATGKGPYSRPGRVRRDHRVPQGEIVFDVPVKVKRMHRAIEKLRVHCNVSSLTRWRVNPRMTVAMGASAEQKIVDGRFEANVKVIPQRVRGKENAEMNSYRCELQVYADERWFVPSARHDKYPSDPDEPLKFAVIDSIP